MHPQTIFDSTALAALQQASDIGHTAQAATLRNYLQQHAAPSGDGTQAAAVAVIARLLGDKPADLATAAAVVDAFFQSPWSSDLDLGHSAAVTRGAIAYDMMVDRLPAATQVTYRKKLADSARALATAAPTAWWATDLVQNHNWVNFGAIGIAGHSLEGEDSDAAAWQAAAAANFAKIKTVQDLVVDGSWHEGIGYLGFGMAGALPYWMGAQRRGIDDDKTELLRRVGRYILYAQLPNQPRVHVMTHGDWNWSRPELIALLRWAARRYSDGYAEEAAKRWDLQPRLLRQEFGLHYALEYVAYDPTVAPVNTTQLSLDIHHTDQQSVVLRSAWGYGLASPAADAIVLGLKAGLFGGRGNHDRVLNSGGPGGLLNFSHDHEDDLGLWIYGRGGWLLPEAVAYNCCYTDTTDYQSTAWHNTIMIDGQGQLGDTKTVTGQTAVSNAATSPGWFLARDASISVQASTDNYAFARADGAKLYDNALGVTTLLRTVAMSRDPGYVVLQDRMQLAGQARRVEQLFHAMTPNTTTDADHPWIRLANLNNSDLGVRVVAPNPYTASVTVQNSNNYQENMDDDGRYALVRVAATLPATNAVFLEVLWPVANSGWALRPAVAPLDPHLPHRGLSTPVGTSTESWIGNVAGNTTAAGDLVITGSDATDFGVRRSAADGSLERLALLGDGHLADGAGLLLDLGGRAGALEVAFTGTEATLSGTIEPKGVRFRGPSVTTVVRGGQAVQWTRSGSIVTVTGP